MTESKAKGGLKFFASIVVMILVLSIISAFNGDYLGLIFCAVFFGFPLLFMVHIALYDEDEKNRGTEP